MGQPGEGVAAGELDKGRRIVKRHLLFNRVKFSGWTRWALSCGFFETYSNSMRSLKK